MLRLSWPAAKRQATFAQHDNDRLASGDRSLTENFSGCYRHQSLHASAT
jgi:hypothetical protein